MIAQRVLLYWTRFFWAFRAGRGSIRLGQASRLERLGDTCPHSRCWVRLYSSGAFVRRRGSGASPTTGLRAAEPTTLVRGPHLCNSIGHLSSKVLPHETDVRDFSH
jgi:hypothetical protein